MVHIYAPCKNSYTEEEREEFFDDLAGIVYTAELNNNMYVMDDFNGNVAPSRRDYEEHTCLHSTKNSDKNWNGQRIVDLCSQNRFFITNTL